MQPVTLYLFAQAPTDERLAHWLLRQQPEHLRLLPAQHHPQERLVTLRYEGADGTRDGAAALGAALRHLPEPWAALGRLLARPGVGRVVDGGRKLLGLRGAPPLNDEGPRPLLVTGPLPVELLVP